MAAQQPCVGAPSRVGLAMWRSSLIVAFCLAAAMVFWSTGSGLAISGLSSVGPAVQAQYPDATHFLSETARSSPVASFASLRREANRRAKPARSTEAKAEEANLSTRTKSVLSASATGPGVREYGSIPLLVSAIGVIGVAGVLRSRRSATTLASD